MTTNNFCELTPKIMELSKKCSEAAMIDPELYGKYDVKRGLRDLNGKGVLVGLTEISDVCSTKIVDGKSVPADGSLYYRGYNVEDIIKGIDIYCLTKICASAVKRRTLYLRVVKRIAAILDIHI